MTKISQVVLFLLLNATWQVTLVALLASAGDRLLHDARARHRHLLWVAAWVACVSLALGSLLHIQQLSVQATLRTADQLKHSGLQQRQDDKLLLEPRPAATHSVLARNLSWMRMPKVNFPQPLAVTIMFVYGLWLLYRAGGLLRSWLRTRALLSSARPVELSGTIAEALARCRRSFHLKRVQVLASPALPVPVTAGTMRPLLILPVHLLSENDSHLLASALGHEAAHIVRRDYLMNLVYQWASLPLWFHPGMGLLLRRIRQTRELRCDELVTERLVEPRIYAQSLVQLAGAALPLKHPAAIMTVGVAGADILEERVMNLLRHSHTFPQSRRVWSTLAALLLAVPCLAASAFAVHVAIRQPVSAVGNQVDGVRGAPAQPSDSGQQSSPPSGDEPARGKRPKTQAFIAGGQHRSDTVLVLAEGACNQAPNPTVLQKPSSQAGLVVSQAPWSISGVAGGIAGGVEGGVPGGVDGGVVGNPPRRQLVSQTAKAESGPSDITEGKLIRLIEPPYPEKARTACIQGDVVLEATIAKTGDLENLRVISGHPIFLAAAMDAVKQWKYEPYRLNAEPVEMETTITFKFRLEPRKP